MHHISLLLSVMFVVSKQNEMFCSGNWLFKVRFPFVCLMDITQPDTNTIPEEACCPEKDNLKFSVSS